MNSAHVYSDCWNRLNNDWQQQRLLEEAQQQLQALAAPAVLRRAVGLLQTVYFHCILATCRQQQGLLPCRLIMHWVCNNSKSSSSSSNRTSNSSSTQLMVWPQWRSRWPCSSSSSMH